MSLIVKPLTFIDPTSLVHLDTAALPQLPPGLPCDHVAAVNSIFVLFDAEGVVFAQFVEVKLV